VGALLDALERQTLAPERFEVLLADPGIDGTRRVVEQRVWSGAELRVIDCPASGGPAAKRNAAARAARGAALAFTDADCVPACDWLEQALRAFGEGNDIVQGRVATPRGERPPRLAHSVVVDGDHGLFETSNILYSRELFRSLGGFTTRYFERYGIPFGEDAELGWRAVRAGARVSFEARAVVVHPVSGRSLSRHVREALLTRGFPQLSRDVPELRERLFFARVFLSRDQALFAAALAGLLLARRLPAAALLALPYARSVRQQTGSSVLGAGSKLLSDAMIFAALVAGSARARALVL
jgi:GT2 family glycosyltransferase